MLITFHRYTNKSRPVYIIRWGWNWEWEKINTHKRLCGGNLHKKPKKLPKTTLKSLTLTGIALKIQQLAKYFTTKAQADNLLP